VKKGLLDVDVNVNYGASLTLAGCEAGGFFDIDQEQGRFAAILSPLEYS